MKHRTLSTATPARSPRRARGGTLHSVSRGLVASAVITGGLVAGAAAAAATQGTISVTPSTPVTAGQTITMKGSGWAPNASVAWCLGVPAPAGAASQAYCNGGLFTTGTADANGSFSGPVLISRVLDIPVLGHSVDCGDPAVTCTVGAADRSDVAGTAIGIRLRYAPIRPTVVPQSGSAVEGDTGSSTLKVPVTLSEAPIQPVSVSWTTVYVPGAAGAQADPATDYTPASGSVTFARGETTKTVAISVTGDTLVEANEYIVVSFSNPVNAHMGGFWGLGFGTITDDDTAL